MSGTGWAVVRCRHCGAPGWISRPIEHAPGCQLFDVAFNAGDPVMPAESDRRGPYGPDDVT